MSDDTGTKLASWEQFAGRELRALRFGMTLVIQFSDGWAEVASEDDEGYGYDDSVRPDEGYIGDSGRTREVGLTEDYQPIQGFLGKRVRDVIVETPAICGRYYYTIRFEDETYIWLLHRRSEQKALHLI